MSFDRHKTILQLQRCFRGTCPAGQTTSFDWQADKNYYLDGAEYRADGASIDDLLSFQAVHPIAGVFNTFVYKIFVKDSDRYEFYVAEVPAGIIIRVTYENNGANDIEFAGNLVLHKDDA